MARRHRETAQEQAQQLRPQGSQAPVRRALTPPVEGPEVVRGPHPDDRFAPLTAEHAEVDRLLGELRSFVGTDEARVARWDRVATLLESHARAEEWQLYPRLRRVVATRTLARQALDQHVRIRELLHRIDAKQGDGPEYRALLEELAGVVAAHVTLEEGTLMPLAVQALGKGRVDELVAAWVRERRKLEPAVADERVHRAPPVARARRPRT